MNLLSVSRKSRAVSGVMAFAMLFSMLNPTIAWSLSTGPGQPELEGFSPIGMSDMVDPFTGDFSYNLPLLQVPGPGGGYPINMSYAAGVGMEQEASWVGLGWSLNPGVVNREIRGLPDDFKGQKITKTLAQRPNQTFGANVAAANLEIFGADNKKIGLGLDVNANINLFYNNYNGFAAEPGLGFSLVDNSNRKSANSASPEPPANTETGEKGTEPGLPENKEKNEAKEEKSSVFANMNHNFMDRYKKLLTQNPGGLLSSAGSSSISDISFTHPMTSSSYTLNIKTGLVLFGVSGDLQVNAFYSELKVAKEQVKLPAYGYLYSEHNLGNTTSGMMDFTLGNQSMLTPDSKILPIPNHTYDIFHVSSQGVSGTVRAYKGGVSKLVEPTSISKSKNIGGGAELNSSGPSNKGGVNLNGGDGESYVGPWRDADEAISFLNKNLSEVRKDNPLLEPYFFKFANELTSQVNKGSIHVDEKPSRFNLTTQMGLLASEPKLEAKLRGSSTKKLTTDNAYRYSRERRAKSFLALSENEALKYDGYTRKVSDVTDTTKKYDVQFKTDFSPESKRIGAIHVVDENGARYVYGIPAKNKLQKQTTFSTSAVYGSTLQNLITKSKNFTSTENSTKNNSGTDHFYSATETPEHAHSYLLTEVLSEDYVDIGEDGPDKKDFGTYTKFNYLVRKDFKSKATPVGADYLPGNLSNNGDDKATITYFEKDLYYLGSIETKTHIAVFDLEARNDAYGVTSINSGPSSSQQQYRLKSITLYNLDDYNENRSTAKPIKTVHFQYSYALGGSVPNAASGKLALEKVWFTVGTEKTQVSLSPYEFTYGSNFPYSPSHVDRWGSYQHDTSNTFGSNILYPYTKQDTTWANLYAGAWNLKEIKLPTGGKINVSYESDQYEYVQNRRAQVMYEIVGFASSKTGNMSSVSGSLSNGNVWMIVKLPQVISNEGQADWYVKDLDQAYFKAFMKMKKFGKPGLSAPSNTPFSNGTTAYDFVEGYVDIGSEGAALFNKDAEGLTNMIAVQIKSQHSSGYHPIKQQGWVELQISRNDLIDESNFDLQGFSNMSSSAVGAIGSIVSKALELFADENKFYPKAEVKGWCNTLSTSGGMKSIVRLNAFHAKVGGGHRVKSITISDEWASMGGEETFTYGQDYHYELEDGSSSGVASYEPLTGGEENPFREPIRYSTDKLTIKNNDLYTELPIGEDFFPAPVVGYSRVVVINKANKQVTTGAAGVQEYEYYTAKDYPVRSGHTLVKAVNTGLVPKLVRFVGNKKYFQPGFSQGFSVELNNMHGQKKSEATYSAFKDYNQDAPAQKKEYYYKSKGGYNPIRPNQLDNKVSVFLGDGISKEENVGLTQDTYVYMKESNESSVSGAIDCDLDVNYVLPVPSAWPNIDYAHTMTRLAVTNKVVAKTGILEKVITTVNGAKTIQENLAYDYETGNPVVSSVTNDFDGRIYTYNQVAKWHYKTFGGNYKNLGLVINGNVQDYSPYLEPGDMLMNPLTGNKAWVTAKDNSNGTLTLRAADGSQPVVANGSKVFRSAYQNKLNESVGYFQTLRDPRELRANLSVFKEYNDQVASTTNPSFTFTDPEYGFTVTIDVHVATPVAYYANSAGDTIAIKHHLQIKDDLDTSKPYNAGGVINNLYGSNPGKDLCIENYFVTPYKYKDPREFKLYYLGQKRMLAVHPDGFEVEFEYYEHCSCHEDPRACFGKYDPAVLGILNAAANDFSDTLKSKHDLPSGISSGDTTGITLNPYAYGMRGIYKPAKSYFFPKSRNQTGGQYDFQTKIQEDGEYNDFYWFEPGSMNIGWVPASQVTQYDYNGDPVEERDALGNYSAVLYGYNRSLPIAIAKNANYNELAFDGFEDHESGTFGAPTYDVNKKDNHINFGSGVALSSKGDAHTGDYSLALTSSNSGTASLSLESGTKYIIQAWQKTSTSGQVNLTIDGGSAIVAKPISNDIEGWQLIEIVFTAGTTNNLVLNGTGFQIDDFKLHPFNASVKAFVYDQFTHKLRAALDENHFATIYNYDHDQSLTQVKKETERGIKTIQSTYRVTSQVQ